MQSLVNGYVKRWELGHRNVTGALLEMCRRVRGCSELLRFHSQLRTVMRLQGFSMYPKRLVLMQASQCCKKLTLDLTWVVCLPLQMSEHTYTRRKRALAQVIFGDTSTRFPCL